MGRPKIIFKKDLKLQLWIEKKIKKEEQTKSWYKEYLAGKTMYRIAIENKIGYMAVRNRFEKLGLKIQLYRKKKNPVVKLHRQIRDSKEYKKWRTDIFERDDYTCQECGKRGCYLEAHHIKEFADIIRENNIKNFEQAEDNHLLFNIDNGVTLCKIHHEDKHLLYGLL